jgi:uncharacterized pyridoxamine 5'-phosphate oxidase family protein/NAD-dependent dihydropyrimidine dehydrogenase PreA subunit
VIGVDSTARGALRFLREVKSVAIATVNRGEPAVRVADVMLVEDETLYLITARGKPYYTQLKEQGRLAICAMDKNYVTVRMVGDVELCTDEALLGRIYEHNPILSKLYPEEKRNILEVFRLYRGRGEFFDLSVEPPKRKRFAFGGDSVKPSGYVITDLCNACGACMEACPVGVISEGDIFVIDGSRCLECGICAEVCPEKAVEPSQGF